MLGYIALRTSDIKSAAAHFLAAHYIYGEGRLFDDSSIEALLFIATEHDKREGNYTPFAGVRSLTSNLYPASHLAGTDQRLGDFATLSEYKRFQRLPPISEKEISAVDMDALLKALIRETS
jgi:hypothetical protein